MPGWCRVGSQGATVPLFNTPHHHSTPQKNTHNPLTSVLFKPKRTQSPPIAYCFNTNKDFHTRKPLLTSAHIPNPQSKPFRVRAEYIEKLRKFVNLPYLEFARRRRYFLSLSSCGWLSGMRRNYSSDLLVLLAVGYWIQGFRGFPWLDMNFYLKDKLMVNPRTLQFLLNTVNLPMVAKPLYGIFSDAVYIGGAHRLPYIVLGGLLQVVSWGSIALVPAVGSSITIMTAFLILSNLGASIVEVATDALVAECGKKQKGDSSGDLQSFAWTALTAGSVLANLFGGILCAKLFWKTELDGYKGQSDQWCRNKLDIPVEVCLTSNVRTECVASIADHHFADLYWRHIPPFVMLKQLVHTLGTCNLVLIDVAVLLLYICFSSAFTDLL